MLILDHRPTARKVKGIRPAIEVEDLTKVYPGGNQALGGITVRVEAGEIFGFLGPNASGKTTTVRILVTLLRQSSGTARVGGFDVERQASKVREVIGYAAQSVGVDDDLSTRENIFLGGVLHGLGHEACAGRSDELLEAFSLAEVADVRAGRLSGGMRRRLDLAQALVHRPAVLFLDEPTTGLDPQSRNAVWTLLRDLSAQGTTVFLTTQYLEEADRACDRVAIIDDGRLVTTGTPEALKAEVGGGRILLSFAGTGEAAKAASVLETWGGVTRLHANPDGPLTAYVEDPQRTVVPLLRLLETEGISVDGVDQTQVTLDDVFLRFTGERLRAEARIEGAVSGMFRAVHGRRRH